MLKPCENWSERLSAYLDGEGDVTERADMQLHLEKCADCRAAAELYRCDAQDTTATLSARGAGEGFVAGVMAKIAAVPEPQPAKVQQLPDPFAANSSVKSKRSWSLSFIEVLVVGSIVVVVGAAIFPVFAKAREKSRQTTCFNNARQLAAATLMYVQDHEEVFPRAAEWADLLATRYGTTGQVWDCPVNSHKGYEGAPDYAYNIDLNSREMGTIKQPTDTFMLFDATNGLPDYRHNGGMVAGFVDGHTAWIQKPQSGRTAIPTEGMQATAQVQPVGSVPPQVQQPTIVPPTQNYGLADKLRLAFSVDVALGCPDVERSLEGAELLFRKYNGFVITSTFERAKHGTVAMINGRVPAEQVGEMLIELDRLGTLLSRKVNGEDVTIQHLETADALAALHGASGGTGGGQGQASGVGMSSTATQLRAEKYKLESRVTLATVTVQLSTEAKPEQKVDRLTASLYCSLGALAGLGKWLLAVLIPLIVFLPVWGPLLWLGIIVRRRLMCRG